MCRLLVWGTWALLALREAGAQTTADPAARDASTCVAEIGVREDRFVVTARVALSPRFRALAPTLKADVAERALAEMLETLLRFDVPLSVWLRPSAELAAYLRSGRPPAPDYAPRLRGPLDWAAASATVRELRVAHLQAFPGRRLLFLPEVLRQIVGAQFFQEGIALTTPLRLAPGGAADNDINNGRLQFTLTDPIAAEDVAPGAIAFNAGAGSRWAVDAASLARVLRPLVGGWWTPREVQVRLADYYAMRGAAVIEPLSVAQRVTFAKAAMRNRQEPDEQNLLPLVVLQGGWKAMVPPSGFGAAEFGVNDFADGPRGITVTEPPLVGEVMVLLPPAAPGSTPVPSPLSKLLYVTLDGDDWQRYRRAGKPFLAQDDSGAMLALRVLPDRPGLRERPWNLSSADLQRRGGALAALDYGAVLDAPLRDEDGAKVFLQPLPRAKNPPPADASSSTPPPLPPPTSHAGVPTDSPTRPRPAVRPEGKSYRHFLRLGAGRREGQGGEFDANYRQILLADRSAAAEFTLGAFREAFGDASLKKDYLFFDQLGRRLGVQAKTYSNYTPDRPLGGLIIDERRSGANLAAEIEIWRARRGHWLQLRFDAVRERVELLPRPGALPASWESSATVATTWFWQEPARLGAPAISLTASLRAARNGGVDFQVARADARYHQSAFGFLEFDGAIGGAAVSGRAPLSAWPQLGGSATVRGYRESAAIGRTLGYAQLEAWLPLRALERRWLGAGTMLRRQLFAAVFVDAGGFDDGRGGRHTLFGAGLGLRFRAQRDIALKLDLAHGLKHTGVIRGGTRLHFDAAIDFPF